MDNAQGATGTAPPAETGPRTDRIELLQQLSAGSVGAVHKARNPKFNRTLALRQLQVPEWIDDVDELIKRILAEARAASALDHPNIARLYTGGYKGFTVFLTSEFVEGTGIREYASKRNLGVSEIVALGKQLCAALDYAHRKGVLHNALTPANLKVQPDGTLKVLDFGLLRDKQLYSPTPAKRLENEHYLSPEQLKNKPVSQATNIFTAATIMYELLTTRNPFSGKHLGEVDRNIIEIDPHPASLAHARVSESISKVLMKGLAKHPLARYQSCAELATALDEALKSGPAKAASASSSAVAAAPISVSLPAVAVSALKPPSSISNAPVTPVANAANKPPAAVTARPAGNVVALPANAPAPQPASVPAKPPLPVRPVNTAVRVQNLPVAPPSKMPVKVLTQWKLVGGIVAALFVVSAVAISVNHRSKVSTPPPEAAAEPPQKPTVQQSQVPQTPQEPVQQPLAIAEASGPPAGMEIQESQPKNSRLRRGSAQPASVRGAGTDGVLEVSSEPEGASFSIEGKTIDAWKTPQVVGSLAPAVYKVTASKTGYSTETGYVQVVAGNRATINLRLKALKATLTVGGTPVGARIVIDGKNTGRFSPADFMLEPAAHTVTLSKEGFFDNTGQINLSAGQNLNYSPSLTPAGRTDNIKVVGGIKKLFGGGSSSGAARMEIRTEPKGAEISLNGATLPKTTPAEIQLDPGNYDMVLQKDGYKPVHKMLTVQANDKVKIDEQLTQIGLQ